MKIDVLVGRTWKEDYEDRCPFGCDRRVLSAHYRFRIHTSFRAYIRVQITLTIFKRGLKPMADEDPESMRDHYALGGAATRSLWRGIISKLCKFCPEFDKR